MRGSWAAEEPADGGLKATPEPRLQRLPSRFRRHRVKCSPVSGPGVQSHSMKNKEKSDVKSCLSSEHFPTHLFGIMVPFYKRAGSPQVRTFFTEWKPPPRTLAMCHCPLLCMWACLWFGQSLNLFFFPNWRFVYRHILSQLAVQSGICSLKRNAEVRRWRGEFITTHY